MLFSYFDLVSRLRKLYTYTLSTSIGYLFSISFNGIGFSRISFVHILAFIFVSGIGISWASLYWRLRKLHFFFFLFFASHSPAWCIHLEQHLHLHFNLIKYNRSWFLNWCLRIKSVTPLFFGAHLTISSGSTLQANKHIIFRKDCLHLHLFQLVPHIHLQRVMLLRMS